MEIALYKTFLSSIGAAISRLGSGYLNGLGAAEQVGADVGVDPFVANVREKIPCGKDQDSIAGDDIGQKEITGP